MLSFWIGNVRLVRMHDRFGSRNSLVHLRG
uniref:Uncharacterized protein n=1 Tax=Arundo donax TaxID=35708 RepID=A0A0A8YZ75_ARUDO